VERSKGARLEAAERTEVRVDRARCIAKETGERKRDEGGIIRELKEKTQPELVRVRR